MLCYGMLRYAILRYGVLSYATLCILWTCERHLDTPKTLNAGTGVCEINTHPTCGTHPTPPIPPYVNVHEHTHIECDRSVK